MGVRFGNPCNYERPSLIYRWQLDTYHLSEMADDGYERLANTECDTYCAEITPHWDRDWTAEVLRLNAFQD